MNRHQSIYATRSFHQPFLCTTTHSHIPRITVYLITPLIIVDDFATREPTTTPPPTQSTFPATTKVSATRRCWPMNTIAAPASHFPIFDNGQQEEDGTYSRESHTLMSHGSTRPPQTHVHHKHLADGE